MNPTIPKPPVTICVLTYGDFPDLARRCIDSILRHCERSSYRLIVGANSVCSETKLYLDHLRSISAIDELVVSETNLCKYPIMRLMFERVDTEFIWWFDDDSYVTSSSALPNRIALAKKSIPEIVMWGQILYCNHSCAFHEGDAVTWVRQAAWYNGLTPPSWAPGGRGELDFEGEGTGNGRWFFIAGGEWFVCTAPLKRLDWPDPRLKNRGGDAFLGEALRQHGWRIASLPVPGVKVNDAERRWPDWPKDPPRKQNNEFAA
jgi:hypothetical protein